MNEEQIEVVWARTGERVWPRNDPRRERVDGRTLRERLDIPRDTDDDVESPLLTARSDAGTPPASEPAEPEPPRGPLVVVAGRVADADARRVLVTDPRDPDLAHQAASALVDELAIRDITAAHLHVGRADHGETPLAGSMDQVDEFVALIAAGGHTRALATGGGEPDMVSATVDRLLVGVDRVILTGTGTGFDPRQARLAELADAVVVRDEHHVFDPRDTDELDGDHPPVVAVLEGLPTTVDEPQPPSGGVPRAALIAGGVLALVAVIAVGWFLIQAATDDGTDVADPPTTQAPPTAAPTVPPTAAPAPDTAATTPPVTTEPPSTTEGGGGPFADIDPALFEAPALVIGDTITLRGAVRTEDKAARMLAAAEILADGGEVDDQLLIDPAAAKWTVVRVEGPLSGLRDGNQFSPAGQVWADAIAQLFPTDEARALLSGGTSADGPQPIAWLLANDLRAKGFEPVDIVAIAPGDPPPRLEAEVDSPEP